MSGQERGDHRGKVKRRVVDQFRMIPKTAAGTTSQMMPMTIIEMRANILAWSRGGSPLAP